MAPETVVRTRQDRYEEWDGWADRTERCGAAGSACGNEVATSVGNANVTPGEIATP